jgi:uncharacterized damage-inducible protein DinB
MPGTKREVLQQWDAAQNRSTGTGRRFRRGVSRNTTWPSASTPGSIYAHLLYFIDNEVHHRGQGYVYLRALGIEPPPFWERD